MKTAVFVLVAAFISGPSAAQTPEPSGSTVEGIDNLPVPSWGKAVIDSFDKPLHPIIGGVVSGGGLGFGIGYESPDEGRWYREGEAIVTVRRYWTFEGEIGRRSASRRSQLGVFGGVRHMNQVDFFGLGSRTSFDSRSAFRLRETTFGLRGSHRVAPSVKLEGMVAAYLPDLGRGANPSVPSVEQAFSPLSIPGGLSAEPAFGRYRGLVEFTHPALADPNGEATDNYGGTYQVAVEAVRDHSAGHYDFHRWEAEAQQRIPGFRSGQRLTLHGMLATTNPGAQVPYYMLYTLGGSGGLKAFRPDMLGTDGTRATLRGFRNYRFRDRNLVLMQAEYRIPLHRYVRSSVFVDSGQVAPHTSALFSDLRTSTGFSLSYVRKGRTIGRMDVGFGGGEGVHVFWSFGALQN